ncbi:MAG: hypothetical protein JWM86_1475 [Thermoleophilia bacterium]|nr:hypothetical protein [Thermoleophilia bacterium]
MDINNLMYGTGGSPADLRATFTPRAGQVGGERGSVLATFKGFGREGKGRDAVLGMFERFNMISGEQRAAGAGAAADALDATAGRLGSTPAAAFAGPGGSGAAGAVAGGGSLYHQIMLREQGFAFPAMRTEADLALADAARGLTDAPHAAVPVAPGAAADIAAEVADAAPNGAISGAADDAAARLRDLEQRLVEGFGKIGGLPAERQVPVLAAAVDATAAAGHGDDTFRLLATALAERPLEASVGALDEALAAVAHAAPAATAAAEVATHAAPVADDAARVAAAAVPRVVEAIAPAIVEEVAPAAVAAVKASLPASSGALHGGLQGAMGFSAGIDDTLRLLARVRL